MDHPRCADEEPRLFGRAGVADRLASIEQLRRAADPLPGWRVDARAIPGL